jgi:hypothetical protein
MRSRWNVDRANNNMMPFKSYTNFAFEFIQRLLSVKKK